MTKKTSNAAAAVNEAAAHIAAAAATSKAVVSSHPIGVLKRTTAFHVDPTKIKRRDGWNPRFDFGEIEHLADSLVTTGMLNPIRIKRLEKPDENGFIFELVDGDRRLTAIELLIKKGKYAEAFPEGIPAIIVDKAQDDLTSTIQMFTANTGKPFLPLEQAAAFKRMRDGKMTIKQIEKATGCSDNTINAALALLESTDELQDAVRTGKIKSTQAAEIAVYARGDKDKQKELTAQAVAAGKDKTKQREVKAALDKQRRAKAQKKGKTLKIRALDDKQLGELGETMAEGLRKLLEEAGMPFDTDLNEWLQGDLELRIAASVGALEALKKAAGANVNINF